MKQETPPRWPPIIEFIRAPWYVRVRDIILTICAWGFLFYLMRNGLWLLFDYLSHPIFQFSRMHSPSWMELWDHIDTFLKISAAGVCWIFLWGIIDRRRLQLSKRQLPPPPIALEDHAASFNLDPTEPERWGEMKVVVLNFDPVHHKVTQVRAPESILHRSRPEQS